MSDLENVISDAISDSTLPPEGSVEPSGDDLDVSPVEGVDAPVEPTDASVEPSPEGSTAEVPSPAAHLEGGTAPFQMDKKLGIPSHTNGRENRIPYSRVTKIVERAEKKAIEPFQKQLAELEPKVKQYEERLSQVDQYEQLLVNDPQRFLQGLSQIPAYQPFFQYINQLEAKIQQFQGGGSQQVAPEQEAVDAMPEPDQVGPDGSAFYSMEGLGKLLEWQSRQVESKMTQKFSEQYDPIRKEWEQNKFIEQLKPQVDAQIAEAMTWPMFKENEEEIVKVLNQFPTLSLEGAYRKVVVPKLQGDRENIRRSVLEELQKAPTSTSAPARQSKPVAQSTGPKSLEDVIADQLKGLPGR